MENKKRRMFYFFVSLALIFAVIGTVIYAATYEPNKPNDGSEEVFETFIHDEDKNTENFYLQD